MAQRVRIDTMASDHFDLLGFSRRYRLEPRELEQRYQSLARETHPDRFAQSGDAERRQALLRSTALNEAYRTLRDPLRRAAYLVGLHGMPIDGQDRDGRGSVSLPPEFLGEFLSFREEFAEATPERAAVLQTQAQTERAALLKRLEDALEGLADPPAPAPLLSAAQLLLELRYYDRFLAELESDDEETPQ
jgi:molecular chaperone HscB